MASPHVAGVAALMKDVNPDLTGAEFEALLAAGQLTNDLGAPGRDPRFGYGLVDARKAVVAALELSGGTLPAILTSNPSALNLGALLEELPFRIGNVGDEAVTVAAPREVPDAPWLTVESLEVDGAGLGAWRVVADRTALSDGLYATDLVFDYVSGGAPTTLTIPVRLQVVGTDLTADAGFHYVLVIDPDSFETVQQVQGPASAGRYLFEFEDILPGTYEIYAGTDSDNDGFICDPGEACGIYRSLSFEAPTLVTVGEQDRTALDFVTGFRSTLLSNGTAATANDAKRIEGALRPEGIPRLRPEAD
jgi:serine protease